MQRGSEKCDRKDENRGGEVKSAAEEGENMQLFAIRELHGCVLLLLLVLPVTDLFAGLSLCQL